MGSSHAGLEAKGRPGQRLPWLQLPPLLTQGLVDLWLQKQLLFQKPRGTDSAGPGSQMAVTGAPEGQSHWGRRRRGVGYCTRKWSFSQNRRRSLEREKGLMTCERAFK